MDFMHIVCVLSALLLVVTDALRFHLPANQRKCLKEEIHKDVLVTGEYELSEAPGQKTTLLVTISLYVYFPVVCLKVAVSYLSMSIA